MMPSKNYISNFLQKKNVHKQETFLRIVLAVLVKNSEKLLDVATHYRKEIYIHCREPSSFQELNFSRVGFSYNNSLKS